MPETWVRSLGWEEPLEKGKATHSSILTWRIPWTIQYMGSQRVGHDRVTFTLYFVKNLNNYKVTKSITQLKPKRTDWSLVPRTVNGTSVCVLEEWGFERQFV